MKQTVLIADLHLSEHTPDLNTLFLKSIRLWQGKIDALYILGDFFEVWVGDDILNETAHAVAEALHGFSQQTPVYFVGGNRDFLLGKRFAALAGMRLLPERSLVSLYGKRYLLMHGDELCTDDVAYMRFRYMIRFSWVKAFLLRLPFSWRNKIANSVRQVSKHKKQQSQNYLISDATEQGVCASLSAFRAADALIHGHTHRPAIHQHHCHHKTLPRYVLPDWYEQQGGYLAVTPDGAQLYRLSLNDTGEINVEPFNVVVDADLVV